MSLERLRELAELHYETSERELLFLIICSQEEIMAGIDDLRTNIATLEANSTAENTELADIVTALQSAQTSIAALQATVAAGGAVTDADLETVAQSVATVAAGAAAATTAAQTADPPPVPASAVAAAAAAAPATAPPVDPGPAPVQ